ncbi:MAG: Ca2+-binding RTX toxin-like protein [Rickettsiales bacterium]|jgi:Ca2+-binding RTX toxin-like protein
MTNNPDQNQENIARITFDIDEYDNIIANTYLPQGSTASASETSSLWSGMMNSLKNIGGFYDIYQKVKGVEVYYDTRSNAQVEAAENQGFSPEDARKITLAFTATDFVVEKNLIPAAMGKIYSTDVNAAGYVTDFIVKKISDPIDDSDIVANAVRNFFAQDLPRNNSDLSKNNSQLFFNESGDTFLLDENQKMTVKLSGISQSNDQTLVSNIRKELDVKQVIIKDSDGKDLTSLTIKNIDKLESSFNNSGAVKTDQNGNVQFFDKNGDLLSESQKADSVFNVEDKDGNIFTAIRDNVFVPLKDGTTSTLNTVLDTLGSASQSLQTFFLGSSNFAKDLASAAGSIFSNEKPHLQNQQGEYFYLVDSNNQTTQQYQYLFDDNGNPILNEDGSQAKVENQKATGPSNLELILADFVAKIATGSDFDEAAIEVAKIAIAREISEELAASIGINNTQFQQGIAIAIAKIGIKHLSGEDPDSGDYTTAAIQGILIAFGVNPALVAGIVTAIDKIIEEDGKFNSDGYQDVAAIAVSTAVVAAICIKVGAFVGSFFSPAGTAVGIVVGAIVGYVIAMPVYNLIRNNWEDSEQVYDAIEDIFKGDNFEEQIKEALKGVEDVIINSTVDLVRDIGRGVLSLLGGYGKELGAGEYWDPYPFLQIELKEDGTGNNIIGIEPEGVVAIAREYFHDDLFGTRGSDNLIGKSGTNTIMGYEGNDHLEGRGDVDLLIGGKGDDEIFGGNGDDQIYGSEGQDSLFGGEGDDIIVGDTGTELTPEQLIELQNNPNLNIYNDFIQGGLGNDQIMGEYGNDTIQGNEGNDIILGGVGDDRIDGGEGDDSLLGEDGDDTILGGKGNDVIDGGAGEDVIYGGAGNDNIRGGDDNDEIYGDEGVDIIYGDSGNDIINSGADNDLVFGGISNDIIYGASGDDSLYGEIGNDYVIGATGDDTIDGGDGDDVLLGGVGDDTITTGSGNDTIIFRIGDGDDTIIETDSSGNDVLRLSEINSVLSDDTTSKIVLTKSGSDLLIQIKNDAGSIISGDSITVKDQFTGSGANGEGSEILKKIEFSDGYNIDLTSLIIPVDGIITLSTLDLLLSTNIDTAIQEELILGYNDQMQNIEDQINPASSYLAENYNSSGEQEDIDHEQYNAMQWRMHKKKRSIFGGHYEVWTKHYEHNLGGTSVNDRIVGHWWSENIYGGAGNDQLNGGDGNDNLFGGEGNDILHGGSGNDNVYGGSGEDLIYGGSGNDHLNGEDDNDTIYGNGGNDAIIGGAGDDNLEGNDGDDSITDEEGNNRIISGAGFDVVNAGAGDDYIEGNDENDQINAGDGNNLVYGNGGNDAITSGNGNDTIYGQEGSDFINAGAGDDYVSGGANDDYINGQDGNDTIYGDIGIDIISGGNGDDYIYGGSGADIINGDDYEVQGDLIVGAGDDMIKGGDGDDWIEGDAGNDILYGDSGSDKIFGEDGNDTIYGGLGGDVLEGGAGDDLIEGGQGNDILVDGSGSDILDGGLGNDILILTKEQGVSTSIDTIKNFNKDEDKIILKVDYKNPISFADIQNKMSQNGDDVEINFDNGQKIIITNINIADISADNFSIGLSGGENNDILFGTDGNDILFGEGGDDEFYGGEGNDELWGGKGADALYGEGGDDILRYEAVDGVYGGEISNQSYSGVNIIFGELGRYIDYTPGSRFFSQYQDISDGYEDWEGRVKLVTGGYNTKYYEVYYAINYGLYDIYYNRQESTKALIVTPDNGDFRVLNISQNEDVFISKNQFFSKEKIKEVTIGQIVMQAGESYDEYYENHSLIKFNTNFVDDTSVIPTYEGLKSFTESLGDNYNVTDSDYWNISKIIYLKYDYEVTNFYSTKNFHNSELTDITGFNRTFDKFVGGDGYDTILMTEGNDVLALDDSTSQGAGEARVQGISVIHAGAGDDVINFSSQKYSYSDVIVYGGTGDDKIWSSIGNDTLLGGSGSDEIYGGDGNDLIVGGDGNDVLVGGDGDDNIEGGMGNDNLSGESGDDILEGGIGDDVLDGGEESEINGDTISYVTSSSGVNVDIASNIVSGGDAQGDTISNFENITGSNFADTLTGDAGNNIIEGGAGDDILIGGAGSDTYVYNAGDGNDTIIDGINNHDDFITFDSSVRKQDLIFSSSENGNDLVIKIKNNETDSLTIQDQLLGDGSGSRIEGISFKNGIDSPINLEHQSFIGTEDQPLNISLDQIEGSRIENVVFDDVNASYDSATGLINYNPEANFNGVRALTYHIKDSEGNIIKTNVINLMINFVNDLPVASLDNVDINEDSTILIDVIAGAIDVDGDELTIIAISKPTHGIADIIGGKIIYKPNNHYNGTDSLIYTLSDNEGGIITKELTINILAGDDAPIVQNIEDKIIQEDNISIIDVLKNSYDIDDGDVLTIIDVSGAINGQTLIVDNKITYIPNPNYHGTETIEYVVSDGSTQITKNVSITIESVNDLPVALLSESSVNEDSSITIDVLEFASDADGDILTISGVSSPSHGLATVENGKITYTPYQDYFGADRFNYIISDGNGGLISRKIDFEIISVNDAPTLANIQNITVKEDQTLVIDVLNNSHDIDGDVLTILSAIGASNGQILIIDNKLTYTPNENYHGTETIEYVVSDGTAEIVKSLDILVQSINDIPVATLVSGSLDEDNTLEIDVLSFASDIDGDILTISGVSSPLHGSAIVENGKIIYTPDQDYFGSDSFDYVISDGNGGLISRKINLEIASVNDAPVLVDIQNSTVKEDQSLVIDVLNNSHDIEGGTLTIISASGAIDGQILIVDNKLTYIPNDNYHGTETIEYVVSDGTTEVVKSLDILVQSVNDLPVATLVSGSLDEDTSLQIDVLSFASDIDGDVLTISGVSNPIHGFATIENSKIIYTPDQDYFGSDSFDYFISDGNGGLVTKTINLTINNVNDSPQINIDEVVNVREDNSININILDNVVDLDGDIITITGASGAQNGSITIDNGSIIYTPNENYFGIETIEYKVSDGSTEVTKELTINVDSVNDNPASLDDQITVLEDTDNIIDILINDSDIEDGTLKKEDILLGSASHGTVFLNENNQIIYRSNKNYFGIDQFTYAVKDSRGAFSNISTVDLNVGNINDSPIIKQDFKDQMVRAKQLNEIDISNIFSDVDGDNLNITIKMEDGSDLPDWISVAENKNIIIDNATNEDVGAINLILIASDGEFEVETLFTLVVKESLEVRNDERINIIEATGGSDTVFANIGTTDLIFAGDGDDDIMYMNDDVWGDGYVAYNSYTGDSIDVSGKIRSYDAFDGGKGDLDTLYLTEGDDSIFLDDLISDNPTISGSRLFGIEIINALGGNDIIDLSSSIFTYGSITLNGSDGDDYLWSNDGNDIINGNGGNDNIIGGRGDDIMSGGDGDDILKGYDGNDSLKGGIGVDVMIGGEGSDTFIFLDKNDSIKTTSQDEMDMILDFSRGQDKIDLSNLDFDSISFGTGSNPSDHGLEYHFENGNTIIEDQNSDFAVKLAGEISLDQDDFNF